MPGLRLALPESVETTEDGQMTENGQRRVLRRWRESCPIRQISVTGAGSVGLWSAACDGKGTG
jgi:hypothetical protein